MTMATARQAIRMAIEQSQETCCIDYFGGEPLLLFPKLRQLTGYAQDLGRQKGVKVYFRLSTNGTLLDQEKLRFCRENNMLFALSLDGDQKAHDGQRPLANGGGSFDIIDSKLDMILRYNPCTVVVGVVTPLTAPRLFQSVKYLWQRGVRYFVHEMAYSDPSWNTEDFEYLQQSYQRLSHFYMAKTRQSENFFLSIFDSKIKSHARSPFVLGKQCDFGAEKISVAPNGKIYPCVRFVSSDPSSMDYCIGDVFTGFTNKRLQLVQKNKIPREECQGCQHLGRCANYCGCVNWQVTGEVTRVPPILCAHERMLIPIADQVGNVLWQEQNAHFLQKHFLHHRERFAFGFN